MNLFENINKWINRPINIKGYPFMFLMAISVGFSCFAGFYWLNELTLNTSIVIGVLTGIGSLLLDLIAQKRINNQNNQEVDQDN